MFPFFLNETLPFCPFPLKGGRGKMAKLRKVNKLIFVSREIPCVPSVLGQETSDRQRGRYSVV